MCTCWRNSTFTIGILLLTSTLCAGVLTCSVARNGSSRRSYVLLQKFLFFFPLRDLRAPSADRRENLPRDRKCVFFLNFITQVPKFGGPFHKNGGPKTCKIRVNFGHIQTSVPNIFGTDRDIQNQKITVSTTIPFAFDEKGPGNFGPLTTKLDMWVWTRPNQLFFRKIILRPIGGVAISNFHTR